ncbi:MAG: trehalase family glycosidase [Bdellovibrionota bacterium]
MRFLLLLAIFASTQVSYSHCREELQGQDLLVSMPRSRSRSSVIKKPYDQSTEDPLIARARDLHITEDFKTLADLIPREISDELRQKLESKAERKFPGVENEKARVSYLIAALYKREKPLKTADPKHLGGIRKVTGHSLRRRAFFYTERMWKNLWKETPKETSNSLIPVPHPFFIAGQRFMESYYWDSYFGLQGLLATGRRKVAKMQIDNFLYLIKNYGLIPNGIRTYYLSRSQPPMISSMVVDYMKSLPRITAKDKAWAADALNALEKDYSQFWMKDGERYISETGLNRHWDKVDQERPERWGEDDDSKLGETYRDVRAEAESGKDFTGAFKGEITKHNPVMLNSILYKYERDLVYLHNLVGNPAGVRKYEAAAKKRYDTFNKILWDKKRGNYFDYNFETGQHADMLTADVYAALWAGLVPPERMQAFNESAQALHGKGGIVSSAKPTGKQWDAPYAWAPHQFFAIQGLMQSGQTEAAKGIASQWTGAIEKVYDETGFMYEKLDGVNGDLPVDKSGKYPNQKGFLWTNAVYVWTLKNVFNETISEP